jgi:PII-like signaling protein
MKKLKTGYLIRVFVGESDRAGHLPLYEVIVRQARECGMAGATVLRGLMGFGRHSVLHTAKVLRLSDDLPMVIEIVDSLQKIEEFLPVLDTLVTDGLVTLEKVQIIHYRPDASQKTAPESREAGRS